MEHPLGQADLRFPVTLAFLLAIGWTLTFRSTEPYLRAILDSVTNLAHSSFAYNSTDISGIGGAVLGTVNVLLLGRLLSEHLLPEKLTDLESFLGTVALGYGASGALVLALAVFGQLYFGSLVIAMWTLIVILALGYPPNWPLFKRRIYRAFIPNHRARLSFPPTWLVLVLGAIFAGAYYHAAFFPILETDAIIYHAPMATIMFREQGLPVITGASVGIESSANYPLLFSAFGAYYYVWGGVVNDIWLRLLGPTMGLLAVLSTYAIGNRIGGRRVAAISAFLISVVPFFVSFLFQTTQEPTLIFFVAASFLFLLPAETSEKARTWAVSGTLLGFALLTTYQAIYFIPAFLVILHFQLRKQSSSLFAIAFLSSAALTGAMPYVRNLVVLRNPVYPFLNEVFQGPQVAEGLFESVKASWNGVASSLVLGESAPSGSAFLEFIFGSLTFPSLFPLNLVTVGPALAILAGSRAKMKKELACIISIPFLLIMLNQPTFIRYILAILPFAAVVVALMIGDAFDSLSVPKPRVASSSLKGILMLMILFPSFVLMGGHAYTFIPWISPPPNYLQYTANPGIPTWEALRLYYGDDVPSWQWLNANLQESQRVATFEYRIHYLLSSNYRAFLYLDGSEAEPLYVETDPQKMLDFLVQKDVAFVFIPSTTWAAYSDFLPLMKFLGSPYFPPLFKIGTSKIYSVGPTLDPIVSAQDPAYVSREGWSTLQEVNDRLAKSVLAGDVRARLFAATQEPSRGSLTYLDSGTGKLHIHLRDPHRRTWIFDVAVVSKHDTGDWKTAGFILPSDRVLGYLEFGLYAEREDFKISKITLERLRPYWAEPNKESYLSFSSSLAEGGDRTWAASTNPTTLMIYLPLMLGQEYLQVFTNSYGKNVSLEIFEGIIQDHEKTNWWIAHKMVYRTPNLPTLGVADPNLSYDFGPGVYTLVIVLWQPYEPAPLRVALNLFS